MCDTEYFLVICESLLNERLPPHMFDEAMTVLTDPEMNAKYENIQELITGLKYWHDAYKEMQACKTRVEFKKVIAKYFFDKSQPHIMSKYTLIQAVMIGCTHQGWQKIYGLENGGKPPIDDNALHIGEKLFVAVMNENVRELGYADAEDFVNKIKEEKKINQ